MGKSIEIQGNTIAEAIQRGLSDLDISIDDVVTEVITHPKTGFFGFGASKAKVRITVKDKEIETPKQTFAQPVEKTEEKPKIQQKEKPKKVENIQEAKKVNQEVKTIKTENIEKTQKAENIEENTFIEYPVKTNLTQKETNTKEFIDGLLEKMNINGKCEILDANNSAVYVNIVGEGLGNVIGRRGDTLDAIQYITNLVVKNIGEDIKVRVDCENYRQKRDQTLEKLALKMGHKVIKYKKNMTLEPMNPYERRKIHEVLQNFRGVHTYSTGKEPNRRVVIGFGEGKSEKTDK